jgi:hypothetical protein
MGMEPASAMDPDEKRGTGDELKTGGARYPNESDRSHGSARYPESDGSHDSARYPNESDRSHGDSESHQTDSDGARSSSGTPSSASNGEVAPPNYLHSVAEAAARKARDEERRAPGVWMPGPDHFDRDPEPGDGTDFGTDGPEREYTSRQLGLRLRPKHYERLLEAARLYGVRPTTMARMMIVRGTNAIHDAELRARARELKESASE